MKTTKTSWIMVIDTKEYAGNFCRELTGYLTGGIKEEGHGFEEAEEFCNESTLDIIDRINRMLEIRPIVDDTTEMLCYHITVTPGTKECNSVMIFFNEKPDSKLMEYFENRARKFNKRGSKGQFDEDITITKIRLVKEVVSTTLTEEWVSK